MKMMKAFFRKNTVVFSALVFLILSGKAFALSDSDTQWNSIETKHTVIRYQSEKDLATFSKKIEFGEKEKFSVMSLLGFGKDRLISTVSAKVDAVYERAQEILDMRRKMKKLTINIYHDADQLQKTYTEIYKESCEVRAWYIFDQNTVYVQADDLHEGMLAHEMAHSIIDHYLLMSPPAASAEILARYVDANLHNKAIAGSAKKSSQSLSSFTE